MPGAKEDANDYQISTFYTIAFEKFIVFDYDIFIRFSRGLNVNDIRGVLCYYAYLRR